MPNIFLKILNKSSQDFEQNLKQKIGYENSISTWSVYCIRKAVSQKQGKHVNKHATEIRRETGKEIKQVPNFYDNFFFSQDFL